MQEMAWLMTGITQRNDITINEGECLSPIQRGQVFLCERGSPMKWLIMLVVISIDQASKWWVIHHLKEIGTIKIIDGIFHLHYLENRGAAFGIFQDQRLFFLVVNTLITCIIIGYLVKHPVMNRLLMWSLILIAGGAIGNIIDRALYGYVIDFFDFQIWPVFNVADSAIVVGQALLIFYILRHGKDEVAGDAS